MINVRESENGKYVQVYGVHKEQKHLHQLLQANGFRWCGRSFRWWAPKSESSQTFAKQLSELAKAAQEPAQ